MTEVSLAEFKDHVDSHLKRLDDGETEIVVKREESEPVVLVSSREWESMKETLYLLSNPSNRANILKSIAQADRGEYQERALIRP